MRFAFLVLILFVADLSLASERLKMTQEFTGEREASDLLESVARCASEGDFNGFMKCFTTKYASGIRRKMKAVMSGCDIDMEILDSKVNSCDEKTINIEARYSWDNGAEKKVFTSNIIARMEAGSWRIASESVVGTKNVNRNPPLELNFGGGGQVVFSNDEDVLPLDIARAKGRGCAGGRCGIPQPQAISEPVLVNQAMVVRPNFDVLPLDMPRRAGGGCAGGRCGL